MVFGTALVTLSQIFATHSNKIKSCSARNYEQIKLLTSCSKLLLEKLMGSEKINESLVLCGTPRFTIVFKGPFTSSQAYPKLDNSRPSKLIILMAYYTTLIFADIHFWRCQ